MNPQQAAAMVPPESFKPVVCPNCGCPVFDVKSTMKYYKGIMAPGPVLKEEMARFCANCKEPFDRENIATVETDADIIPNMHAKAGNRLIPHPDDRGPITENPLPGGVHGPSKLTIVEP